MHTVYIPFVIYQLGAIKPQESTGGPSEGPRDGSYSVEGQPAELINLLKAKSTAELDACPTQGSIIS